MMSGMNIGGMLSSFFNPEDAYIDAQKEAGKGWEESKGFQKPFVERGLEQYPGLLEAIQKLKNPGQMQNEWSSQYQTSPYAQQLINMNKDQGLEAASSMGLMGSSGALSNIQQGAGDIASRDRKSFMDDLMNKYMASIGLGSNIYGMGASTAGNLGNQSMRHGENMAGLKYGEKAAPGELLGNLISMGMKAFGGGMM